MSSLTTPRSPECPSDFVLSEFEVKALPEARQQEIQDHVAGCDRCKQWLEDGRSAFEAISDQDKRAVVAAMSKVAKPPRRRLGPPAWLGGMAAAAAALIFLVKTTSPPPPSTTVKGSGLSLRIYVEREGVTSRALSGERFFDGDRLRFEVDLPTAGQAMVVGREADGSFYRCYPNNADHSMPLPAGSQQLLPDAVELDESLGREMLYLVLCPDRFELSDLLRSSETMKPGPECQTAIFELEK